MLWVGKEGSYLDFVRVHTVIPTAPSDATRDDQLSPALVFLALATEIYAGVQTTLERPATP